MKLSSLLLRVSAALLWYLQLSLQHTYSTCGFCILLSEPDLTLQQSLWFELEKLFSFCVFWVLDVVLYVSCAHILFSCNVVFHCVSFLVLLPSKSSFYGRLWLSHFVAHWLCVGMRSPANIRKLKNTIRCPLTYLSAGRHPMERPPTIKIPLSSPEPWPLGQTETGLATQTDSYMRNAYTNLQKQIKWYLK